ncbi:DUF1080 domain-containing protein [Robertkochia solimangrovi]|nr:DUF1080 domain-containing protein [Robertkochia solimangrovi]
MQKESNPGVVSAYTAEKYSGPSPTTPEDTEYYEPVPAKVTPVSAENNVPSDAEILFDGSNLDAWKSVDNGEAAKWIINPDGSMTVKDGAGDIETKERFGDIQLHIEWKNPETPRGEGQHRGNSGIFLQGKYELQVLDNYDNPTYVNGQAGSLYKQYPPLVNAANPSGEWQKYDIIYHAPQWDKDGNKTKAATITVLLNGVLVQDHTVLYGTTEYIGWPKDEKHGDGPLKLQDHHDNSGVSFRNIWVRKL